MTKVSVYFRKVFKLVLEPIFEADFQPCSYGFRPRRRRAQDAIAEIHYFGSRHYEWVFEADITACFDEIDHVALMERVRRRIKDKAMLSLVKAFLRSGVLSEAGPQDHYRHSPLHPLTVVGQYCVVRDRRALHPEMGSARTILDARQGSSPRNTVHETHPLRGRLRGDDSRHARERAGALRRSGNGGVYCCCVPDTCSRRIVGWSIDSAQDTSLVVNALDMAIKQRRVKKGSIVHADYCSQFTSWSFIKRIRDVGLMPSFGSVGDAFDNAMMESFWSSMQNELLDRKKWKTRLELTNAIFDY